MDADPNKIIMESVAFQSVFMGVLHIICVTMELLFLVQIATGD